MSHDRKQQQHFESLLIEFHEALLAGNSADAMAHAPAEIAGQLRRAQDCVARLHALWTPPVDTAGQLAFDSSSFGDGLTSAGQGQTIGRFRIDRELGLGGAGIVFLAVDPKLDRQVALKVPRPESLISRELRERFLREAEAAARLSHRHIVTVYEVGQAGPICYIASEYCAGASLAAKQSGVSPRDAAALVADLAAAVHHAHVRGVLHRDLKPSNILLAVPKESQASAGAAQALTGLVPKVADFGLAKLLEREGDETRTGTVLGTPQYMAPEQAEGRVRDIGVHTDVYALGAILYELLTGTPPHVGTTDSDTLRRVMLAEPLSPRKIRSQIPADLEAICLKCLEKDPENRYVTAAVLEVDLHRFLAGAPTEARPLSPVARAWKSAKRRPALAALVTVIATAATAMFGMVLSYNARLSAEVTRAEREADSSRQMLYSADVRLAHESIKSQNLVQALDFLNRHVPPPGREDLREFCWYYLREKCQSAPYVLKGHDKPAHSIVFSPDGRLLATGGEDGTARIWDANTGKELQTLRTGEAKVNCVAFSPDGVLVAAGTGNGGIQLWDVATGKPVNVLKGHQGDVFSVAFSPEGELLASGGRDKTVQIWDVAGGALIRNLNGAMDIIRSVAFSSGAGLLLVVDEAERMHAWRSANWQPMPGAIANQDRFLALAVSRAGWRVAAAGWRGTIYIWEPDDEYLQQVARFAGAGMASIEALAFSPHDDCLASAGGDRVIRLWRPGESKSFHTLVGHRGRVWALGWSPDGRRLASAGADAVRVWSVTPEPVNAAPPPEFTQSRFAVVSPDGGKLITSDNNGGHRVWDANNYSQIARIEPGRSHFGALVAADNRFVATIAGDRVFRIRQQGTFEEVRAIPTLATYDVFAWAPDGDRVAVALDNSNLAIVDVASGAIQQRFKPSPMIRDVSFTPDGSHVVTTGDALQIWDLRSGRAIFALPLDCHQVCVSQDGRLIAVRARSEVLLVDRTRGHKVSTLVTGGLENGPIKFCGSTLAVGFKKPPAITLWDTRTLQELLRLDCDGRELSSIAASPDGNRLIATGIATATIGRIWEWTIHKDR